MNLSREILVVYSTKDMILICKFQCKKHATLHINCLAMIVSSYIFEAIKPRGLKLQLIEDASASGLSSEQRYTHLRLVGA